MLTEDYCDFETAKLLREKGFDEPCNAYWFHMINAKPIFNDNMPRQVYNNKSDTIEIIGCPTIQMAMKWLREVHKISIEITSTGHFIDNDVEWECDIKANRRLYFRHITNEKSFESCAEAAIKYCLENLI